MLTEQELCFGLYRVALEHGQVWRDQHEVKLTPKALAVLRVLILGAGHLVTKEELFQAVWPDTIVSDDALTTCILELRQTLRDNAKRPRFIETVYRRGYRFIAPLTAPPSTEKSGARSQGSDSSSRPPPSPQSPTPAFVGREPELTQLHQWLEKALSGERQIVFVTGEAGIGKTALVDAFLQTLNARRQTRGAPPWFAYGQCIEHYGPGEPYLPILAALGRLCRTPEGKHLVTFLQHHAPTWLVHMPAVLEGTEVEALQRTTAGATRERMLRELAEAVEVLTADRPLLLWLEDLQWCDRSTLDWLSFLARRRERARLLILGSYRPIDTIIHGHPLRLVKHDLHVHRQCEELPLRLLSEAAVAEYLAERFSIAERNRFALTRVARLVHRRTDGNPLFMVNVVDALITQGMVTVGDKHWELRDDSAQAVATIPASLRQMIEHQVEQLTVEGRRVLEAASVAGMDFSAAAVAAGLAMTIDAAEEQCTTLVRRGQFIHTTTPTEWPDGTVAAQYAFLHAFYQEVAYERIPTGQRQELHRRIGERKEAAYGGHAGTIAAELGVHFTQGRDFRRAVHYLGQAAQRAMWTYAYLEAIDYLNEGIALLSHLPESPERTRQELALQVGRSLSLMHTRGFVAPEVEDAYRRVRTLCGTAGDSPQRFAALWGLRIFHLLRGELVAGHGVAQEFLDLVQRTGMSSLAAEAHLGLGTPLFFLGEFAAAQPHLEQALTLYNPQLPQPKVFLIGQDPRTSSLAHLAVLLWIRGCPDHARERCRQALALAQETAFPYSRALTLNLVATLFVCCRDFQAVAQHAEAARVFAQECGYVHLMAMGMVLQGWAFVMQGQGEEGLALMQTGLTRQHAAGIGIGEVSYQLLLVEAYTRLGQREAALQTLATTFTAIESTGERTYEAEVYRLQGELKLQQESREHRAGNTEQRIRNQKQEIRSKEQKVVHTDLQFPPLASQNEAEASFYRALAIAQRQQAKSLELRASTSLARLWQQQDKKKQAHKMLSKIYRWFTEGFDTPDLQAAQALLEELA